MGMKIRAILLNESDTLKVVIGKFSGNPTITFIQRHNLCDVQGALSNAGKASCCRRE